MPTRGSFSGSENIFKNLYKGAKFEIFILATHSANKSCVRLITEIPLSYTFTGRFIFSTHRSTLNLWFLWHMSIPLDLYAETLYPACLKLSNNWLFCKKICSSLVLKNFQYLLNNIVLSMCFKGKKESRYLVVGVLREDEKTK